MRQRVVGSDMSLVVVQLSLGFFGLCWRFRVAHGEIGFHSTSGIPGDKTANNVALRLKWEHNAILCHSEVPLVPGTMVDGGGKQHR